MSSASTTKSKGDAHRAKTTAPKKSAAAPRRTKTPPESAAAQETADPASQAPATEPSIPAETSPAQPKGPAKHAAKKPAEPEAKDPAATHKPAAKKAAPATPTKPAPAPVAQPAAPAPAPAPAAEAAAEAPAAAEKILHLKPPITARDLAEHLGAKPYQIIHDLMELNVFAALGQTLEPEAARKICAKRGVTLEIEKRGSHMAEPTVAPPPPADLPPVVDDVPVKEETPARPPVITFMGHVDHGKTSLMDAIRKANVVAGEAGGITQHIGAYSVEHAGHRFTFLDTPGHQAFSAMRARGANLTDIVVLVVAADDGLMPQTLEAISHAKAAGVKIMVAINKIDLPGANLDRVKKQLQEQGLVPEEWGGDTIVCEVSATKKQGIDRLLENMVAQSEILEIRATDQGLAKGRVVEAQLESGRGPTATVLIQNGTLRVGDAFLCGDFWGKVKGMIDDKGRNVKTATPAMPVKIIGFSGVPLAGDSLEVVADERESRQASEERLNQKRLGKLEMRTGVTLENLFETLESEKRKVLRIVLKADVQGSLEAISAALNAIESQKVSLEIIHGAVGPVTESDINLASASNAVVIGFNTRTENSAAAAAKRESVQIKLFSIIYELIDQVREAMAGLLEPLSRETVIGTALCKKVIELSKFHVAGCAVVNGRIARNARARVLRNRQPIYDGSIVTLKRFQDEVPEVRNGLECGIRLGNFDEYLAGDTIECYVLEKVPQQL